MEVVETTGSSLPIDSEKTISICNLGLCEYLSAWETQKDLQRKLINGETAETLIVARHFPVITAGRSTKPGNLLINADNLAQRGVKFFEVERGGDVTYHDPGQIVLYPIIDLNLHKRDVAWYMRQLEEVIIRTLKEFNIEGLRIAGKTGVWLNNNRQERKIASIGVRISRWRTMHGLSLNVKDCNSGFSLINPCGYSDIEITSIEQEKKMTFNIEAVTDIVIRKFSQVFGYNSKGQSE